MKEMFDLLNFNLTDFLFQVLNVSVLVFFLHKYLFQKVMQVIDARNQEVESSFKDIDDAWVDVKHQEKKYNHLLSQVNQETSELMIQAKQEGKALKEKIEKDALSRAEADLMKARAAIENEKNMAMEEIMANAADLVIQGAEAVLKKEISKEDHQPMLDEFIAQIGEKNG